MWQSSRTRYIGSGEIVVPPQVSCGNCYSQGSPEGADMKKEDRQSYMMLFCALLLVRNSKATLEESMKLVPLVGSAKHLAGELASHTAPLGS